MFCFIFNINDLVIVDHSMNAIINLSVSTRVLISVRFECLILRNLYLYLETSCNLFLTSYVGSKYKSLNFVELLSRHHPFHLTKHAFTSSVSYTALSWSLHRNSYRFLSCGPIFFWVTFSSFVKYRPQLFN